MGCGGYLAAKSDMDHYDTERLREEWYVLMSKKDFSLMEKIIIL